MKKEIEIKNAWNYLLDEIKWGDCKMKPNEQKPPLGLMPRAIWEAKTLQRHAKERKANIVEAIKRYLDDGKVAIPQEWIREYNEIVVGSLTN